MKKMILVLCVLLFGCSSTTPLKEVISFSMKVTSDLHYQVDNLEKQTAIIPQMIYNHEIVDAFFKQPGEVLLLGGDNTNNGRLAEHLVILDYIEKAQQAGTQTIIVPGNHDLNEMSKSEYKQLYRPLIYDKALVVDEHSLSYVHQINASMWVIVLDTNDNRSNQGELDVSTFDWLKTQLAKASELGVNVIVAAHHNLLVNSLDKYTQTYLINEPALLPLLKKHQVSLFLSGHRHTQQVSKDDDLFEIVSSTPIDYPNSYSSLFFDQKSIQYEFTPIKGIEVENFEQFSLASIEKKSLDFAQSNFKQSLLSAPDQIELVTLYQAVMKAYYEGNLSLIQDSVKQSEVYQKWLDLASDTTFGPWLEFLIEKEAQYDASFVK